MRCVQHPASSRRDAASLAPEVNDHPRVDGVLPDDGGVGVADAQLLGTGDRVRSRRDSEKPPVEAKAEVVGDHHFDPTGDGAGKPGVTVAVDLEARGSESDADVGVDGAIGCVLVDGADLEMIDRDPDCRLHPSIEIGSL